MTVVEDERRWKNNHKNNYIFIRHKTTAMCTFTLFSRNSQLAINCPWSCYVNHLLGVLDQDRKVFLSELSRW